MLLKIYQYLCLACGRISVGTAEPPRCPQCGGTQFQDLGACDE